ncbi:NUDIX domain-containing protein (plasmid) [Streptomyces yangpuensis]|uniref:NUDIX domain-containing protein n=1 Tax=Streptomyces yangpuensis TaxID=1648182 RepID=A0ABY5Q868_9ACTN|nr:NUDIX domain-containing protein [Streptomyces yangpuensis]UUY52425.1 NUDIX domain-containing protein [Streptomyces yangpuensis]
MTPSRHVLLIEHGWPPSEGAWAQPRGHVDAGEAPYLAAARELAEGTVSTCPSAPCTRSASGTSSTGT